MKRRSRAERPVANILQRLLHNDERETGLTSERPGRSRHRDRVTPGRGSGILRAVVGTSTRAEPDCRESQNHQESEEAHTPQRTLTRRSDDHDSEESRQQSRVEYARVSVEGPLEPGYRSLGGYKKAGGLGASDRRCRACTRRFRGAFSTGVGYLAGEPVESR